MKNYKYPKTKKLIKQLKPYSEKYSKIANKFWKDVYKLEQIMEKVTGIKGIEFYHCDGEIAGIGNADRSMSLIHWRELE
jgi:hypothetical protein